MNQFIKTVLQRLGIYHPLQSRYRSMVRWRLRRSYRRIYKPFAGGGYTCNVCGARYSRFVPDLPTSENKAALEKYQVVAGYGEHILCPNCLSTARERLVIACLDTFIRPQGKNILHLSPEPNVYDYLKKKGTVVTADLHPGFYRHIDPAVRQEDITALSFADGSFDLLVANHVLEHIPDDRRAMAECFRVLKPGGRAVLQVPYSVLLHDTLESPNIHDPDLQSVLYGQEDHVRIYALKDYMCRLEQAGFEVAMAKDPERTAMLAFATQPGEEFILVSKPGIISTSG